MSSKWYYQENGSGKSRPGYYDDDCRRRDDCRCPGPRGPQGPQGLQGVPGPKGCTAPSLKGPVYSSS